MYNLLLEELEKKNDTSLLSIVSKIEDRRIDKEVLELLDNTTDYIELFNKFIEAQRASSNSLRVTPLIILTKIDILPTVRTIRYI